MSRSATPIRDGLTATCLALVVAALAMACPGPPGPEPTSDSGSFVPIRGGGAIIGQISDITNLNPIIFSDAASARVSNRIFQGLVDLDPKTGAPVPLLAKSWTISPDGLTYTFTLRDDVKWHDGQPFTAADVKFTWETVMDPKTTTPQKSSFDLIAGAKEKADGKAAEISGIKVLNPTTLQVTVTESFCPFLINSTSLGVLPKHLLEKSADINTDDFNTKNPVGTGPFKFKEWLKDDHVTVVANDAYWGGRPNLDSLTFRVVRDTTVLVAQLKTGETEVGAILPAQLAEVKAEPGLVVQEFMQPSYSFIAYNLARPFFQDKLVRQALTHGLDRQKILDRLVEGKGILMNSHVPPTSWAYDPNVPAFNYDPARSKQLLQQAGYSYGPDGTLRDKDNRPIKITMHTNAGNRIREGVLAVAKEQWKEIGIEVDAQAEAFPSVVNRLTQSRDFDTIILGWSLGGDPDARSIFHSEETRPGGFNAGSFKNPEVDRLLDQGRSLPGCDQGQRKAIYGQFQRILGEEQPYAFLFAQTALVVTNAKLRNIQPSPHFGGDLSGIFWNAKDWYSATGK